MMGRAKTNGKVEQLKDGNERRWGNGMTE